MSDAKVRVQVEGRQLTLSNLEKVLYPEVGFTKGEVLDYYTRIAAVLLPHLAGRPVTLKRYPDGVSGGFFFEKNRPSHTPAWVRTARLPSPGSTMQRETIEYVLVEDLPTLVWCANLAALELHVPMWRVDLNAGGTKAAAAHRERREGRGREARREDHREADLMVFDLDPGAPATIVECCRVACLLRDELSADGLRAWAKTSGQKGLQVYVPLRKTLSTQTSAYAKEVAQRLERGHAKLVVSRMAKALRPGKVLVDWSQNNAAKTTVAVYSLRAQPTPTVSAPLTWEEVESCRRSEQMRFTSDMVLRRVARHGDLLAPLLEERQRLPDPG
ncbi:MAG: ATP-dependent DNA ligase [Streptosporangiales bacterium]|nr:ATP-dependent DNA ligase [Streptosporangiales bacterium]